MDYSAEADFQEKEAFAASMELSISDVLGPSASFMDVAPSWTALELGGSGGLLAGILCARFKRVICVDIKDHQKQYSGEFVRLLKTKFQSNGRDFDYGKLEFHVASAMDLPYRDGLYDCVYSSNAFEHIPDPVTALREAIRVTRPGGVIYLSFGPIWTAYSGSHFIHLVSEPWRHLLLSNEEYCRELIAAGGSESQVDDFLYGLNRRFPDVYRDSFPRVLEEEGVREFRKFSWGPEAEMVSKDHPNRYRAAETLNIDADDLLIQGFSFVIQR